MRKLWLVITACMILLVSRYEAIGYGSYYDDDDRYYDDDDRYYDDDDRYNDDDDSNDIPLDGGLSFLAVAGAGLGIKKIRDARSNRKK